MTRMTWRVAPCIAAATIAVLTTLPGAAQAVAPFGTAHEVLPANCSGSMTVLDSAGYRHGFVACGPKDNGYNDLYAVTASPSATTWARSRVATNTSSVLAVADDGTASYTLYDTTYGAYVLSRSRSGATHTTKVGGKHSAASGDATLIARDGKWWAMWSEPTAETGGTLCLYLFQARTMDGAQNAHDTGMCGMEPSLALTSGGTPVLAYRASDYDYGGGIYFSHWTGHKWTTGTELNKKEPAGLRPDVVISGNVTRVCWLQSDNKTRGDDVDVASKSGNGAWHTKRLTTSATGWDYLGRPHMAMSDGRTFLGWTVVDAKTERKERTEIAELNGGRWSYRAIEKGKAGANTLEQLDASAGRAQAVLEHNTTKRDDVLARQ